MSLTKPNAVRPVNLNLMTMRFPLTAIVSILHRISGFLIFLFIPFVLWIFSRSLNSPESFFNVQSDFQMSWVKVLLWLFLSGFTYHLIAGIRHLIMVAGIGESLKGGRWGARITLCLAIGMAIIFGVWLW